MDGHQSGYRDYFSQASSSSPAPPSHSSATGPEDEDFAIFFLDGIVSSPILSTPRIGMENLDLNSQGDDYRFIDTYSGLLQSEGGHDEPRLPPLAPVAGGSRSGHGAFQPPCPSGGGGRSGHGGSLATCGGGRCSKSLNTDAGTGHLPQGSTPPLHSYRDGRRRPWVDVSPPWPCIQFCRELVSSTGSRRQQSVGARR